MAPKLESSNDPSKDQTERSSQSDQLDEMLDNQLGLTEEEKALDPDREGLDARARHSVEVQDRHEERREPAVEVKEDKGEIETPLAKALKTIEAQERRLTELESRPGTTREERREPQIEMVEILPNLRLPKDKSQWPLKVTVKDLIALGWNEEAKGPAEVLNILGNALYLFAVETIPDLAGKAFETRLTERETMSRTQNAFEGMFPHLVKHRDIVSLIERNERQNPSSSLRGKFGNDYYKALGQLGEAKIADIRGITVEQYRAEAVSQRKQTVDRGKPRTVSTGSGVRPGTRRTESDFERDSGDL